MALDITFNYKTNGLSILSTSSQQKTSNTYNKYAAHRVNNLNNEAKLNSDWLEPIFKEIPLWLQYAYAYEHKQESKIANKILPTLLSEYLAHEISLMEVVCYLNTLNRYSTEALNLLPVLIFRINLDLESLKKSNNSVDQALLYSAFSILRNLPYFKQDALSIEQIPETIQIPKDIFARAEVAKYLLTGAYYLHLKNKTLTQPAEAVIKKIAYELMMVLEPDGCLPQLGKNLKRVNYREALFYGSEVFNTNDLRFVAQGGLRNDGTNQPLKNEIFIKEAGYFVSKSTWNIVDIVPPTSSGFRYQNDLGQDACQFTFDAINQEISFYGFSKPLVKLKLLGIKIDLNAMILNRKKDMLIEKDTCVVDEILIGKDDIEQVKITFIRSLNAIIIDNKRTGLFIEITTCRSQVFNDYTNKEIKTVHKVSPMVFYSFTHQEKHKGNCTIKGNFTIDEFNDSIQEHSESGYYNKIVLSKINYIILEAQPLLLPDMSERHCIGDKRIHQVNDLTYNNGTLRVKKSFMQLTLGPLKKEK
jgi:hypothetical protein